MKSYIDSLFSIANGYKFWVEVWTHDTWEHWQDLLNHASTEGYRLEQAAAHRAGEFHVEASCPMCLATP